MRAPHDEHRPDFLWTSGLCPQAGHSAVLGGIRAPHWGHFKGFLDSSGMGIQIVRAHILVSVRSGQPKLLSNGLQRLDDEPDVLAQIDTQF